MELRRTIILYICSTIESLLLVKYRKLNEPIIKEEYKFTKILPENFRHYPKLKTAEVVVSVRVKRELEEHEIGVTELVKYFVKNKFFTSDFAQKIHSIIDIRNTFHFGKKRDGIVLDDKIVEDSFSVLYKLMFDVSSRRIYKSKKKTP